MPRARGVRRPPARSKPSAGGALGRADGVRLRVLRIYVEIPISMSLSLIYLPVSLPTYYLPILSLSIYIYITSSLHLALPTYPPRC